MSGSAGHCACLGVAVKKCSVCVSGLTEGGRCHNRGTCTCVAMVAVMCVVGVRIQV